MPKPERRSLSQLPPPPAVAPIDVSREQERTILTGEPVPATVSVQQDSQPAGKQDSQLATGLASKTYPTAAEPKVALTTRIPQTLKTRLVRIARYNDLEIETIILRALERELDLDIYEKPAKWGREE